MRKAVLLLASMTVAVLWASGVVVALLLLAGAGPRAAAQQQAPQPQARAKPNIVFVLTDDQFPGSEQMMPSLTDDVTREGAKFANMTSTFPLCCPGRATIQRGQYAHNTRITGNSLPRGGWEKFRQLGLHKSTVATWLDAEGYQTGLFGKYMNSYGGEEIPPGWDRWYAWNGPKEGWTSGNDQGRQEPLERREADSLVADQALEFLANRLERDAPMFAFVNFGAMHHPFHHASVDAGKFRGARVPRAPASTRPTSRTSPPACARCPGFRRRRSRN